MTPAFPTPIDEIANKSTAHPCMVDLERRFSRPEPSAEKLHIAQMEATRVREIGHMPGRIKNPRTLLDLSDWADRDPYGFVLA